MTRREQCVWDGVVGLFDKSEIVRLLAAICAINVWNRMAISTHQALPERDGATKDAVANLTPAANEDGHGAAVVG